MKTRSSTRKHGKSPGRPHMLPPPTRKPRKKKTITTSPAEPSAVQQQSIQHQVEQEASQSETDLDVQRQLDRQLADQEGSASEVDSDVQQRAIQQPAEQERSHSDRETSTFANISNPSSSSCSSSSSGLAVPKAVQTQRLSFSTIFTVCDIAPIEGPELTQAVAVQDTSRKRGAPDTEDDMIGRPSRRARIEEPATPPRRRRITKPKSASQRLLLSAAGLSWDRELSSDDEGLPLPDSPSPPPRASTAITATQPTGPEVITNPVPSTFPFTFEHVQQPTTPRRRWGFGNLVNSVTKFIPRLSSTVEVREEPTATVTAQTAHYPTTRIDMAAQTAPHPSTRIDMAAPDISAATPSRRPKKAHRAFKSKRDIEAERKTKAKEVFVASQIKVLQEEAFIASQIKFLQEEEARKTREAQEREEKRIQAEKASMPKRKRKRRERRPSPEVIPNPPGCSYGMDLDYFCISSSEDEYEDEEMGEQSPLDEQQRPAKKAKMTEDAASLPDAPQSISPVKRALQSAPRQVLGDPHRARPYTGVIFADHQPRHHGGNVFSESVTREASFSAAAPTKKKVLRFPPMKKGPGTFCLDYNDFSSSDEEDEAEAPAETPYKSTGTQKDSEQKSSANSGTPLVADTTPKSASDQTMTPSQTAASPSVTWTQPPPARPTPAHAALPVGQINGTADTDALARARSLAEKYKPKQPSGLRASSRLSTSTVGSDVHEDEAVTGDDAITEEDATTEEDAITEEEEKEVKAAVSAIPGKTLMQFDFPRPTAGPEGIDPEVWAALDANWTKEDTDRAYTMFEDELFKWKQERGLVA